MSAAICSRRCSGNTGGEEAKAPLSDLSNPTSYEPDTVVARPVLNGAHHAEVAPRELG
jgi:hypothetical protein